MGVTLVADVTIQVSYAVNVKVASALASKTKECLRLFGFSRLNLLFRLRTALLSLLNCMLRNRHVPLMRCMVTVGINGCYNLCPLPAPVVVTDCSTPLTAR